MTDKTCAACDCKLDSKPIQVTIGGKAVEVCCEECAQKLKEVPVRKTVRTPSGLIAYAEHGAGPVALFVHGVCC
jgi:hypothetical protein